MVTNDGGKKNYRFYLQNIVCLFPSIKLPGLQPKPPTSLTCVKWVVPGHSTCLPHSSLPSMLYTRGRVILTYTFDQVSPCGKPVDGFPLPSSPNSSQPFTIRLRQPPKPPFPLTGTHTLYALVILNILSRNPHVLPTSRPSMFYPLDQEYLCHLFN